MAGVPLVAVKEYLGHSDLTMTMRYSHLSPSAHQDYVAVLDPRFRPQPAPASPPAAPGGARTPAPPVGGAAGRARSQNGPKMVPRGNGSLKETVVRT